MIAVDISVAPGGAEFPVFRYLVFEESTLPDPAPPEPRSVECDPDVLVGAGRYPSQSVEIGRGSGAAPRLGAYLRLDQFPIPQVDIGESLSTPADSQLPLLDAGLLPLTLFAQFDEIGVIEGDWTHWILRDRSSNLMSSQAS